MKILENFGVRLKLTNLLENTHKEIGVTVQMTVFPVPLQQQQLLLLPQKARKFKKVEAKKLVKSNKSKNVFS